MRRTCKHCGGSMSSLVKSRYFDCLIDPSKVRVPVFLLFTDLEMFASSSEAVTGGLRFLVLN